MENFYTKINALVKTCPCRGLTFIASQILQVEGIVAVFALVSVWIVLVLRPRFQQDPERMDQGMAAAWKTNLDTGTSCG